MAYISIAVTFTCLIAYYFFIYWRDLRQCHHQPSSRSLLLALIDDRRVSPSAQLRHLHATLVLIEIGGQWAESCFVIC